MLGDTIKFLKEPELSETFNAKVIGLLRYNSFEGPSLAAVIKSARIKSRGSVRNSASG